MRDEETHEEADVRQWTARGFHEDSAVDCINYAALKAEALARGT